MTHVPVLLQEVFDSLNLKPGDIFLDATLGSAGHSSKVAEHFRDEVEIIGLDQDPEALQRSEGRLRTFSHLIFLKNRNFRELDEALEELGVGQVNAVLFDLGFSSEQMDESGRGFTFRQNEPLDMRMSGRGLTAAEILNGWDEKTLELVIRGFGEEKYSKKIASQIVLQRVSKPFETTQDLLEAVHAAVPASYSRMRLNPATKTFQAIRMAVNEELAVLEEALPKALKVLAPGGRLAVISFHSLEDRIVKNFFKELVAKGEGKAVTKKPIVASEEEVKSNPRSRSAKLRVLEKIISA